MENAAEPRPSAPWQLWIDSGGTFTDCLARDPGGQVHRAKVLSSAALRVSVRAVSAHGLVLAGVPQDLPDGALTGYELVNLAEPGAAPLEITGWEAQGQLARVRDLPDAALAHDRWAVRSPEPAPLLGIRLILGVPLAAPLPPIHLRLATTRATNALLERKGSPVTLFVTQGFADLLEIGTQQRPDLFALQIVKPRPLPEAVHTLPLRGGEHADFAQLQFPAPPSPEHVAAISLLHGAAHPAVEAAVAERLRVAGWQHVVCGSELSGRLGYLQRTRTVAAEAFLESVMRTYLDAIEASVGSSGRLLVMSSRGALLTRGLLRYRDTLLSGPAGGLLGAGEIARRAGSPRTLTFDMGGTSTDVARQDGRPDFRDSVRVGEAELQSVALRIETIAAGGGSICSLDQGALKVGPESAGSAPGPACYGGGGPLTITDVNVLLGRLDPAEFGLPLALEAARAAAETLLAEVAAHAPEGAPAPNLETLLEGLLEIANEKMAEALRRISVQEGYDPRDYALTAFGGAGGWHACALAARLGIDRVIFPADAGLLSAFGLSLARREFLAERQLLRPLADCAADLPALMEELAAEGRAALAAEGVPESDLHTAWQRVSLRLVGQEATLEIPWTRGADLAAAFAGAFHELFGFYPGGKPVEVVLAQVLVAEPALAGEAEGFPEVGPAPAAARKVRCRVAGAWRSVPVYPRAVIPPGARISGPAIIQDRFATCLVESGWQAHCGSGGTLRLDLVEAPPQTGQSGLEAVELELFTRRFTGIVEQMGALLRRTALSVNIRERLDFSCGLLDAQGNLVANAPHIPVHLGALGLCVRSVAARLDLRPGDMVVTNHPAHGGSHLPDITVIAPVHTTGGALLGYLANRAHHAELGGIRPGSMPPGAASLAEEGVVIPPTFVVRGGEVTLGAVTDLLTSGPHPTRALRDNLADLQAQIAANRLGAAALQDLARQHGVERVGEFYEKLAAQAAASARRFFAKLPGREWQAQQTLENGAILRVRLERRASGGILADFTGTSVVTPDNFNATPAIVRSALIYVLRVASAEPIPLNEGFLREVEIRLPTCLLNPAFQEDPAQCPAVVAGNVETSQRLVDTLLRALGIAAASQGTMNNTVFGNAHFGYYETLGGGSGAVPGGPGASGVHCHMSNTAITDPEVLEARYPVRLRRFELRPGSGGVGRFPGGQGLLREYEFLEPVEVSLLTERRTSGPYGMVGGGDGAPGWQKILRASGREELLPPSAAVRLEPGDRLLLATPGGGAWGAP